MIDRLDDRLTFTGKDFRYMECARCGEHAAIHLGPTDKCRETRGSRNEKAAEDYIRQRPGPWVESQN